MTDECQIRITTIRIHQRFVMNGELYTFLERKYIKKGKCYEDMNGLTFVIIAYNESKKNVKMRLMQMTIYLFID